MFFAPRIRPYLFAALIVACAVPAMAQQFVWHSYTAMTNVREVTVDAQGNYWAATAGGAYRVAPATAQYDVYRNIDALSTINVSAVAADPRTGVVAFGGQNGEMDFLTGAGVWHHSLDIKLNEQRRGVNALAFGDSLLYIAADYGISLYDVRQFAFIATCKHLGAIPTERRALALAMWQGTLYVGTESGLAYIPMNTPNIADSAFWSVVPTASLPNRTVNAVAAARSYVFAGTPNGLCAWDGTAIQAVTGPAGQTTANVVAIAATGDTVYAATATAIFQIVGLSSTQLSWTPPSSITSLAFDAGASQLLVGTATSGMMTLQGGTSRTYASNSPGGNIFSSISIDGRGVLWGASAILNGSGSGIYRFDGTTWKTYSMSSRPAIPSNDIQAVSADSLGNVWAGTYGQGLIRVHDSGDTITASLFNETNSPFSSIPEDASHHFILVGGSAAGQGDVQWIVPVNNLSNTVHPHLIAYDPHANNGAGVFYPFECPASDYHLQFDVVIDGAGTKWISPMPPGRLDAKSPPGLMYFNEGRSLASTDDDVCGVVGPGTAGPNPTLRTKNVTAVALDNQGELWVGSSDGINIIGNPEAVLKNPANLRIRKPYLSSLNGENANVTCILVDPLDNKWVGTLANGLFVVDATGQFLLAHFDKSNSPILDDQILALAANKNTGVVYIGTKYGLSTVSASGLIQSVGSELKVGPQPYIIPSTTPLYIYGVPQDAEVKIFTVSGAMVRDYAPGDLAQLGSAGGWDGKDSKGEWVASGIYLVTFSQPDGTTQVKKFAVVRK